MKKIVPAPSEAGYVFDVGATVDEFAEHFRAIAGMPLAEPQLLTPAVTASFTANQLMRCGRSGKLRITGILLSITCGKKPMMKSWGTFQFR
ncbi:hypothetical protein L3X07_14150 [Levilactobacillus brevis]|nr:hypothetical protein [Levilactobacillus brevis]